MPIRPAASTTARSAATSVATCRQTPDVALDANPNTGYIIYCSVAASGCVTPQYPNPWFTVGGTSGSAPLMAAIAADANSYSQAHAGTHARMGFANPFLYANAGTFNDVQIGNNNIYSSTGNYFAKPGYDLATGLGSPDAMALATALTSYTPGAVTQDASQISISAPLTAKTVIVRQVHYVPWHAVRLDRCPDQQPARLYRTEGGRLPLHLRRPHDDQRAVVDHTLARRCAATSRGRSTSRARIPRRPPRPPGTRSM